MDDASRPGVELTFPVTEPQPDNKPTAVPAHSRARMGALSILNAVMGAFDILPSFYRSSHIRSPIRT
jgi:hypothetical protein